MEELYQLSDEFLPWMARLHKATPTDRGIFRLVNIRKTAPKSFEELRIIALVLDENGHPIPNVPVVFGYSTGPHSVPYVQWAGPWPPYKALVVSTQGSGQIDQVQGSAVKEGQPGGVTVYVGEPDIASDWVSGCGMLEDHTGLHLTFQRQLVGVLTVEERLSAVEARLSALEGAVIGV